MRKHANQDQAHGPEVTTEVEAVEPDHSNKKVFGALYRPNGAVGFGALPKDLIDRMLAQRATARVDSNVSKHFSAGKMLALGAFGATAKSGGVYIYFTVDDVDVEVWQPHRNAERQARKWVVEYNRAVMELRASDPAPAEAPAAAVEDPMETLRKLGALHDSGLITDEEFAEKRDEVIGRI